MKRIAAIAMVVVVMACAQVEAASIAINFCHGDPGGDDYMSQSTSGGRTGSEQTNWNNVTGEGGTFYGTIDSTGATLPVAVQVVKAQGENDSVWEGPTYHGSGKAPYCQTGAGRDGYSNSDPFHFLYHIPYTDYNVYVWRIGDAAWGGGDPGVPDSTYTVTGATPDSPLYIGGVPSNGLQPIPSGDYGLCAIQIVPTAPAVNNDLGVRLIDDGMFAALRGTLVADGVGDAQVWVYWGPTDGVTNKLSWATNYWFGAHLIACPVLYTNFVIGPLGLRTDYWYRYYASNSAGTCWATNSVFFKSEGGTAVIVR
jgi:hypothetical protein